MTWMSAGSRGSPTSGPLRRRGLRFPGNEPLIGNVTPYILLLQLLDGFEEDRIRLDVYAPVGLAYIAAALERDGFRVRLEALPIREAGRRLPTVLRKWRPDLLGISATGNEIDTLKELSRLAKARHPSLPIVAGGYCCLEGEPLFDGSGLDVVVVGEGEETIAELAPLLLARRPIDGVKGILFRSPDGRVVRTPPREGPAELDDLPLPSYGHFPAGTGVRRVYASRGCPFDCSFCEIKDFYGRKRIRFHGPDYVRRLLQRLIARGDGPVRSISFNDDEFLLDPGHLERMAGVARELGLLICFQTRTGDVVRHAEVLAKNRDVIEQVHMGVESFSQSQLDRWSKRAPVAVNRRALEVLSGLGISYYPYLILSDARTTVAELEETCQGLVTMPPAPYPAVWRGRSLRSWLTPIQLGVHLNRLKTYHGKVETDPRTAYLDAVWIFLEETRREAGALSGLALLGIRGAGDRVTELLDERILRVPAIASEASSPGSAEFLRSRALHHAARFRAEARRARAEAMVEHLAGSAPLSAVPRSERKAAAG